MSLIGAAFATAAAVIISEVVRDQNARLARAEEIIVNADISLGKHAEEIGMRRVPGAMFGLPHDVLWVGKHEIHDLEDEMLLGINRAFPPALVPGRQAVQKRYVEDPEFRQQVDLWASRGK